MDAMKFRAPYRYLSKFTCLVAIISITALFSIMKYRNIDEDVASALSKERYLTISFGATCNGGGLSNKVFEFVSLYAISRTLNRLPYVDTSSNKCIKNEMKEMATIFPNLVRSILLKELKADKDVSIEKCHQHHGTGIRHCIYEDVEQLEKFNSTAIHIVTWYLHSFKFFHRYKQEVLELLSFTERDIARASQIAKEVYTNDTNHSICVHTRRGDFVKLNNTHPPSTEKFTRESVLYVRQKLQNVNKEATVVLLGDDRTWLKSIFPNGTTWIRVPTMADRPSVDYAFFARHCNTIILTASASTFGFWIAYLSSAETVYFNMEFLEKPIWKNKENIDIFFPSYWKGLRLLEQNNSSNIITEIDRSAAKS